MMKTITTGRVSQRQNADEQIAKSEIQGKACLMGYDSEITGGGGGEALLPNNNSTFSLYIRILGNPNPNPKPSLLSCLSGALRGQF